MYFTEITVYVFNPFGLFISTTSSTDLPIRPFASGLEIDNFLFSISDS